MTGEDQLYGGPDSFVDPAQRELLDTIADGLAKENPDIPRDERLKLAERMLLTRREALKVTR